MLLIASLITLITQSQPLTMSVDMKDRSGYAPYSDGQVTGWQPDKEKYQEEELDEQAGKRRISIAEGQSKHNQLGWKRLTVGHCYLPSI